MKRTDNLTVDKATPKWKIGHDLDAKLPGCREHTEFRRFKVEDKGRVFNVQGADWMNCLSTTKDRFGACGESNVLEFSFPNIS